MSNPLLTFWKNIFGQDADERRIRRATFRVAAHSAAEASATIFLILRRMRVPLIVLIVIFSVSVLGLTVIPGQDAEGNPIPMGFFDAFYVMSYTATTIGFGEIPFPFTYNQRMWVTVTIYLTVIGWAYAIGSLLALLQDRAFRQALALQQFRRRVARLREPFLLIDDDEANLAVTMTAALLRPDVDVVTRTTSPAIAERMRAFGRPSVINPFD